MPFSYVNLHYNQTIIMRKIIILFAALSIISCNKSEPTGPGGPGNNNTNSSSLSFKCKINGIEIVWDTAYAAYGPVGSSNRLQVSGVKMSPSGDYPEHAISFILYEPDYIGAGEYVLPDTSKSLINYVNMLVYTHFTSFSSSDSYGGGFCEINGIGEAGLITINNSHEDGEISGMFYGSVCSADSVITITDGVFNNVVVTQ